MASKSPAGLPNKPPWLIDLYNSIRMWEAGTRGGPKYTVQDVLQYINYCADLLRPAEPGRPMDKEKVAIYFALVPEVKNLFMGIDRWLCEEDEVQDPTPILRLLQGFPQKNLFKCMEPLAPYAPTIPNGISLLLQENWKYFSSLPPTPLNLDEMPWIYHLRPEIWNVIVNPSFDKTLICPLAQLNKYFYLFTWKELLQGLSLTSGNHMFTQTLLERTSNLHRLKFSQACFDFTPHVINPLRLQRLELADIPKPFEGIHDKITLFQNLEFLTIGKVSSQNMSCFTRLTNLRHLEIKTTGPISLAPLSGLYHLQSLIFPSPPQPQSHQRKRQPPPTNLEIDDFTPLLPLANLQTLSLDGKIPVFGFFKDLLPLSSLTELNVGTVPNTVIYAGFNHFFENKTNLKKLTIRWLEPQDHYNFFGLTNLQDLRLSGVGDHVVQELSQTLTRLEVLHLTDSQALTDSIFPFLQNLTRLTELDLSTIPDLTNVVQQYTKDGIQMLTGLQNLKSLTIGATVWHDQNEYRQTFPNVHFLNVSGPASNWVVMRGNDGPMVVNTN